MEFPIEISQDLPSENITKDVLDQCVLHSPQETTFKRKDVENVCEHIMQDMDSIKSSSSSDESPPKLSVRDMIQRFNIAAEAAKAGNTLDKRIIKSRNLTSIGLSSCKPKLREPKSREPKSREPKSREPKSRVPKSREFQRSNSDQSIGHVTRRQSQLSLHIRNTFIETKETEVVMENCSKEPTESEYENDKHFQHINSHLKLYALKEAKTCGVLDTMEPSHEEINMEYQSKTTITRTAHGVRIIIDLLFDPSKTLTTDVVGNRIETTLPHSRILNEFQERVNKSTSTASCNNPLTYGASNC